MPGPHGCEPARGRAGGRSRPRAPAARGRSRAAARVGRDGGAPRGRRTSRRTRASGRPAISKPAAPAWPPWRMNRSRRRSSVAPRSSRPSLRHDARIDVAQLGADDRRSPGSSTRRDATSPTIPTGHGPRTIVTAVAPVAGDRRRGLGHRRLVLAHRRRVRLRAPCSQRELGREPVRLRPDRRSGAGRPRRPPRRPVRRR